MKKNSIMISEQRLKEIIAESVKKVLNEITIDKDKVYHCSTTEELKNVMLKTMLDSDDINWNQFICEVYFDDMAFMLYRDDTATLTLRYHTKEGMPKTTHFLEMGDAWKHIVKTLGVTL